MNEGSSAVPPASKACVSCLPALPVATGPCPANQALWNRDPELEKPVTNDLQVALALPRRRAPVFCQPRPEGSCLRSERGSQIICRLNQ